MSDWPAVDGLVEPVAGFVFWPLADVLAMGFLPVRAGPDAGTVAARSGVLSTAAAIAGGAVSVGGGVAGSREANAAVATGVLVVGGSATDAVAFLGAAMIFCCWPLPLPVLPCEVLAVAASLPTDVAVLLL